MLRVLQTAFLLVIFGIGQNECADRMQRCNSNQCENGGTCFLIGSSLLRPQCRTPFTESFEGHCFAPILATGRTPADWFEAQRYCTALSFDAQLISIDDAEKAAYVSRLMEKALKGNAGRRGSHPNLWTAGRFEGQSLRDSQGFMWHSGGESRKLGEMFWESGQPNTYALNNDSCIVLTSASHYQKWAVDSCEHGENFFVCQAPLPHDKDEQTSKAYQCRCRDGFTGLRCELQSDEAHPAQHIRCSNGPFSDIVPHDPLYSCHQPGTSIQVDYAAYGMPLDVVPEQCKGGTQGVKTCWAKESFVALRSLCQGRSACWLNDFEKVFPHSCNTPGVNDLLEFRFRCTDAASKSRCPSFAQLIGERCYEIVIAGHSNRLGQTWKQARESCRRKGGDLAGPIDAEINDGIGRQMLENSDLHDAKKYWISMQIDEDAKIPMWQTNGQLLDYKPQDSLLRSRSGMCGSVFIDGSVSWQTTDCNEQNGWICEFAPLTDWSDLTSPTTSTESITSPETTAEMPSFVTASRTTILRTLTTPQVFTSTADYSSTTEYSLSTEALASFTDGDHCPATVQSDLHFPAARVGSESYSTCPDGFTGFVTLKCLSANNNGTWDKSINFGHCRHAWMAQLEAEAATTTNAPSVMSKLRSRLQAQLETVNDRLLGADVATAVNVVNTLLDKPMTNVHMTRQLIDALSGSTSLLLSQNTMVSWNDMPQPDRHSNASRLMLAVERTATLMAHSADAKGSMSFEEENINLHIDIQAPTPTQSLEPQSRSSMTPPPSEPWPPLPPSLDAVGEGRPSDTATIQLPNLRSLSAAVASTNPIHSALFQNDASGPQAPPRISIAYYVYPSGLPTILKPDNFQAKNSSYTTVVNSQIIGAKIGEVQNSLQLPSQEPVKLELYHLETEGVSNPRCVFWDVQTSAWSTAGCSLIESNAAYSHCECDHMTAFAVLMDIQGNLADLDPIHDIILTWITQVGCIVSIGCLTVTIAVFILVKPLWCTRTTIHRNLCICLLIGEWLFMFGIEWKNKIGCTVVAALLHYFFLCAFAWMLLEGYQLYCMLIRVFQADHINSAVLYMIGYVVPAAIVAISAGIRHIDYGTDTMCWINPETHTQWAFFGPVSLVIVCNVCVLALAFKAVFTVHTQERSKVRKIRGWLRGSMILLCLLGLTWVFGYFLVIKPAALYFAYIFTILNCVQGVFIFVFHILFNDKVQSALVDFGRRTRPNWTYAQSAQGYHRKNQYSFDASDSSSDDRTLRRQKKSDSAETETTGASPTWPAYTPPPSYHTDTNSTGHTEIAPILKLTSPAELSNPPLVKFRKMEEEQSLPLRDVRPFSYAERPRPSAPPPLPTANPIRPVSHIVPSPTRTNVPIRPMSDVPIYDDWAEPAYQSIDEEPTYEEPTTCYFNDAYERL